MESDSSTENDIKEVSKKVVVDLTVEDEKKPKKIDIKKKIEKEKKRLERRKRINMKYSSENQVKDFVEQLGLDLNLFMKYYEIVKFSFFYIPEQRQAIAYKIGLKNISWLDLDEEAEREAYNKILFGMSVREMYQMNTIPTSRAMPERTRVIDYPTNGIPTTRTITQRVIPPVLNPSAVKPPANLPSQSMLKPIGELTKAHDKEILDKKLEEMRQKRENQELLQKIQEAAKRAEERRQSVPFPTLKK